MKKFKLVGIVVGSILAVLLLIALILPFVIDVDKYRPRIVAMANEKINGKLELGKLSLSLWGQIRIDVAGVKLADASGKSLLGVKDAFFHLPLLSVLSGSPVITFKMNEPSVQVSRSKSGKLNWLTLVKDTGPAPQPSKKPSTSAALPAIAANSRLGVELRKAKVAYRDEASGLTTDIRDLNLILRDISLSRPTALEMWADLDTRMGKTLTVKGPAMLTGGAQPELAGGKLSKVFINAKLDLDGLAIEMPGSFEKKKGIAANMDLALEVGESEALLKKLVARFHNAELQARGQISNLTQPVVDLEVHSNEIALKPWVDLVPSLKNYELGGSMKLDATVQGPSDKLGYKGKLTMNALTAKAPKLKTQPRFDGMVAFATDQIESLQLTMKAPGNDLSVKGRVVSFSKPAIDLQISSTGLDLDQLVEFPPPSKSKTEGATAKPAQSPVAKAKGAPTAATVAPEDDMDALLEPIRQNKMLRDLALTAFFQIKSLKAYDIKMSDMQGRMFFGGTGRELATGLEGFSMRLWDGNIRGNVLAQLKPATPTYIFGMQVDGLQLAQAVQSQMALFKDTVVGKAFFDINGQGTSFNTATAKTNLTAKGSLRVDQPKFTSIDIGKMVSDSLNGSLQKLGDRIPELRGKTLGGLPNGESKYHSVSGDFSIANGKFSMPNFYAKALPGQGVDIRGDTEVGLVDSSLKSAWEVSDPYNLTKARDLSPEIGGVKVDHILAEGNNPVRFVVHAGCTISAPCYSYTEVPEAFAKIALANVGQATTARAKQEVKKRVGEAIPKNAPPEVRDALKGLFGR